MTDKLRRRKWWTALLWLLIAAAAVPLAGRLEDLHVNATVAEMPRGAPATRVAELAARFPDGGIAPAIVVYQRDSGLTRQDKIKIEQDRLRYGGNPVTSADGQAAILVVPLPDDPATLAGAARAVRENVAVDSPGLTVKLTGPAGAALDAADAKERTDRTITLVTLGVVILLLLIVYRSPLLWILPLLNVGLAVLLARATQYILGAHAGLTVDPENAAVVTVLIYGVGTDYALLLLARYREELRRHPDRHEAMRVALRGAAPAIVASAATVSLGLLCLLAADMGFNHALGSAGAIAVVAALLSTTTLFPALLLILGRRVFWPLIPRAGATPDPQVAGGLTARRPRTGATSDPQVAGHWIARRPRTVWLLGLLVLAGLTAGMSGMRIGLTSDQAITGHPESIAGQELLATHFPAGQTKPVRIVAAIPLTAEIRALPGVASVGEPVRSTDGTLVRTDAVLTAPVDSTEARATVQRIRDVVGQRGSVGGATAEAMERDAAQTHDHNVVIPLVLGVVLILLLVLLRAFTGSLVLMATVVASYAAAFGAAWLIFRHVFGFPAVDVQLPLIGFLFVVALGADYNIFLLSRAREEIAAHGYREGLLRALAATSGVITSAGVVLAATFAALTLAPQVAFKEIGILVAVAVLLDAMLVRLILVPAIALDLGRWFWWPARPGRPDRKAPLPARPRTPADSGDPARPRTSAAQ
ncbi:MMPL family transporter [Actinoplanes sp. L3-i22]|uniref:MMPL family transporter n=1 Tax=Actinoplanes sp. L3-i22 TaxID=2836373 RepID=UPI001C77E2B0|nr:MMPL family transporter [Actinoplanes sp. L3-i22]BCY13231.1 putative membrane protein ActII-3 [Actinoplanes sp. L3-i22]